MNTDPTEQDQPDAVDGTDVVNSGDGERANLVDDPTCRTKEEDAEEKLRRREQERFVEWLQADAPRSEQEQLEYKMGWWDATLRASEWVERKAVAPLQAAMLLCGFNPLDRGVRASWLESEKHESIPWANDIKERTYRSTREDHESVLDWCKENGGEHSLKAWHAKAAADRKKVHPWLEFYFTAKASLEATPKPKPALQMPWKMEAQAIAAELWSNLRNAGANPTVAGIVDQVARICADRGIKTASGINPTPGYLRTHVLSAKHWTPPPDNWKK